MVSNLFVDFMKKNSNNKAVDRIIKDKYKNVVLIYNQNLIRFSKQNFIDMQMYFRVFRETYDKNALKDSININLNEKYKIDLVKLESLLDLYLRELDQYSYRFEKPLYSSYLTGSRNTDLKILINTKIVPAFIDYVKLFEKEEWFEKSLPNILQIFKYFKEQNSVIKVNDHLIYYINSNFLKIILANEKMLYLYRKFVYTEIKKANYSIIPVNRITFFQKFPGFLLNDINLI
jgi:hypothetical protein